MCTRCIRVQEFLHVVKDEISPQLANSKDKTEIGGSNTPTKPDGHDFKARSRPKRNYTTTYNASYLKPGMLPVKSLDELKAYTDFLQKIAKDMGSVREAFLAIDVHREGFITKDELRAVCDNFGMRLSQIQFQAVFSLLDQNRDGKGKFFLFFSFLSFPFLSFLFFSMEEKK